MPHKIYCIIKKILRKIYGKQTASSFVFKCASCEVKIIIFFVKGFRVVVKQFNGKEW